MLKQFRTHMRWIMLAIVVAFLLSTFLMYGDGGSRRKRPEPSEDGTMQDYVVATISGQNLMRSTLDTIVRNYIQQANVRDVASTDVPMIYKTALDGFVFQRELEKEVASRNIDVSEDEITKSINALADQFPTREAFYQYIERSGIKMEDLRGDVKHRLATEKTLRICIGDVVVSDDDVEKFYDATKLLFFRQPKGFNFDVAQLKTPEAAEKLITAFNADPSAWDKILSEDIASSDIINKTTADSPIFASEAALSADEKMRPLLTVEMNKAAPAVEFASNDFRVFVKREMIGEKVAEFDEVSADIRAMVTEQEQRAAYEKYAQDLINRANVVIVDDTIFPAPASADAAPAAAASADSAAESKK